ncbi:MAG: hypothetical protein Q9M36_02735 [Sulfurovum sp.]|nr:hypothetical protein [Sulfurovum sp.]
MALVDLDGLTPRDRDIFRMMAEFGGRTFNEVLERTYWHGKKVPLQQARDRITKIKSKYRLIRLVSTGLMKPRNAIAFTDFGKRYILDETDIEVGNFFLSPVTVNHSIAEMITWYWIRKSGRLDVSRTIVKNWSLEHKHTPDLLYFHNEDQTKPIYVEIELNAKSTKRYLEIFNKCDLDKVHAIFYVFSNEKKMRQLGRKLPINDKIHITNIDDLIINVSTKNKIGALKQIDFIKKYEGK